jgi:hypothetical protein
VKLRNVVERTYGVFKQRFQIFQHGRDGFSLQTQNKIIYALYAVHNWIMPMEEAQRRNGGN